MAIFAHIDNEARVQLNDKTRFDASKCFVSRGSSDISTLTIKAGSDGSAIDCYDANPANWFLDWAFSTFNFDIDSGNADISFSVGSTDYTGTVSSGTYTLAQFATALASAMTTAASTTFTASVSNSKITVSAGVSFAFKASSIQELGFFPVNQSSTSITGNLVEHGIKIVTVSIENQASESASTKAYVSIYNESGDALYSNDSLLTSHEPDILKWVKEGRASFKDVHRRAQDLIIQWLDKNGYVNIYGVPFSKLDIIDHNEVKDWSTYLALRLIFEGISNATDDVFSVKAKKYASHENDARQRAILRIDTNKDGVADSFEGFSVHSGNLYRR